MGPVGAAILERTASIWLTCGSVAQVRVDAMGFFRPRPPDLAKLEARREQLLAEIEVVDADAAWTSLSDDTLELAEGSSLRRQTDALRRALADLDHQIADARRRHDDP
jgi:hypothetical protein